jgi:uncharacterized protein
MTSAMAVLGLFVFGIQTLPYQSLDRTTNWRYPTNSRIGRRPSVQFLGAGEDILNIAGSLRPEITGGQLSLAMVRYMAEGGKAWPFIQGNGISLGMYVIEEVTERGTEFYPNGQPRAIDFTIKLKRADDSLPEVLGVYTPELLAML